VNRRAASYADNKLIVPTKKDRRVAYEKIDFFHSHKSKILGLAASATKLSEFPTKRNPRSQRTNQVTLVLATDRARATQISLDDIESFRKAWDVHVEDNIPRSVSEAQFRDGVQLILGDLGHFADWGGENNDLYSTNIRISGRRCAAGFAFKGPGTRGKLTPGKLGRNGDQLQRLFETAAQVFLVQYCGQIDQSVVKQMESLAAAKSLLTRQDVWYGILDGQDSYRIYRAYANEFKI